MHINGELWDLYYRNQLKIEAFFFLGRKRYERTRNGSYGGVHQVIKCGSSFRGIKRNGGLYGSSDSSSVDNGAFNAAVATVVTF